jgi:hypothetical protein
MRPEWTDEDAAFAAAQWASGVKQKAIGKVFGYSGGSIVCVKIEAFLAKYVDDVPRTAWGTVVNGDQRKALVKQALAAFVKRRNGDNP